MPAPEVADLVDQFTPLVLGIARAFGRTYLWLADDFESEAARQVESSEAHID